MNPPLDNQVCPECGGAGRYASSTIKAHFEASGKALCETCHGTGRKPAPEAGEQRLMRLEAENKELRHLWEQNEGWLVELQVRVNRLEGHVHSVPDAFPDGALTETPLVDGEDNEGQEIWKAI